MAIVAIIDDQTHVRKLLVEELLDMGHQAYGFGPEQTVVGILEESKPDLVIMDLYMGLYDGFRIFSEVKKISPQLSVIIFTAYDSFKNDPRLSKADAYIVKSMNLDPLKTKISKLLVNSENCNTFEEYSPAYDEGAIFLD